MIRSQFETFTKQTEEALVFPILTKELDGSSANGSSPTGRRGGGSSSSLVADTIRQVTGWRPRVSDTKGFAAALEKSFALRTVEGHTEWTWTPRSYSVQADLGEITGAQASIAKQAQDLIGAALPLLDGLKALRPDVDVEESEAMRAIVRHELGEIIQELKAVCGPRVHRIDNIFGLLIGGEDRNTADPEFAGGQLGKLRDRYGFFRARVNTVEEERHLSDYLILVDYVNALSLSWDAKRNFFLRSRSVEPFLGTQLALISQQLDVIGEAVRNAYLIMDSVYFGHEQRQATELLLEDEEAPITVAELLSWVEDAATNEGRKMLEDGGKDGVNAFQTTLDRLEQLVAKAATLAAEKGHNPARGFHTCRVAQALGDIGIYLRAARDSFGKIRKTTIRTQEDTVLDEAAAPFIPESDLPPRLDSINPEEVRRGGSHLLRLEGDNFDAAMKIEFHYRDDVSDEPDVAITGREWKSESEFNVTIKVGADAPVGEWALVVTNPGDLREAVRHFKVVGNSALAPALKSLIATEANADGTLVKGAIPQPSDKGPVILDAGKYYRLDASGQGLMSGVILQAGAGVIPLSHDYTLIEKKSTIRLLAFIEPSAPDGHREITATNPDEQTGCLCDAVSVKAAAISPTPPEPPEEEDVDECCKRLSEALCGIQVNLEELLKRTVVQHGAAEENQQQQIQKLQKEVDRQKRTLEKLLARKSGKKP